MASMNTALPHKIFKRKWEGEVYTQEMKWVGRNPSSLIEITFVNNESSLEDSSKKKKEAERDTERERVPTARRADSVCDM